MNAAESLLPNSETVETATKSIAIEGITEPTIIRYFETLNSGDFEATTALFTDDGALKAPFESPLVGREAIATYLNQEAQGMKLEPREGIIKTLENQDLEIQVSGKVQTSWCGVNVSWLFILNQQRQITSAIVKLLASPQELLNLQKKASNNVQT